jgi:Reversibly glycosylated polypeptide
VNVLVLPTNRPDRAIEFLEAWRPWPWDRIVVVEDGPEASAPSGDRVFRFCWRDIDLTLDNPGIISRRDSAIRAYGFWQAWRMGADVVFTLDDDCFPVGLDYVDRHLQNMTATPRWGSTVRHLRVRGLPYTNVGALPRVAVSVGLWVGHPDIDAVQSLARAPRPLDAIIDRGLESWVLPAEQYFPICGMNLALRREVICLMYFPPMGLGSPYARFDDIWAGLVLQRICRHLRLSIVCGHPVVEHRRASDPFVNLVKEAPGIRANESIWESVERVHLTGADPLTCMREMGTGLRDDSDDEYVRRWGRAIAEWCRLFDVPAIEGELAATAEHGHG